MLLPAAAAAAGPGVEYGARGEGGGGGAGGGAGGGTGGRNSRVHGHVVRDAGRGRGVIAVAGAEGAGAARREGAVEALPRQAL